MTGPGGDRNIIDSPQEIDLYRTQGYKFKDEGREAAFLEPKSAGATTDDERVETADLEKAADTAIKEADADIKDAEKVTRRKK